jgi:flagellar M-ring protein FliF
VSGRISQALARAKDLLKGFTPGQRGVIAVAMIALVLGAVALTRWAAQPTWTPLYTNLSGTDASAVVEQLGSENVQYKLSDGGSTVLVPQTQVYDLRVQLAGKGLPTGDDNSYSVLDDQGLTATDFQQNIAYRRALESELDKTLQSIDGVKTAIVHLAIPQKDVFSTEEDKATASVLLSLNPGFNPSSAQVRAVTNLVAGSVEGLDPNEVTVTDATGTLLSAQSEAAAGAAAAAGEADAQTAAYETRLGESVQSMLDKVLGPGKAVVRVNAQLNYDARATTSERFVSEEGVDPLAQSTVHETYVGSGEDSSGAMGQVWPTLTGGEAAGGSYERNEETRDNAVGTVVESAQAAPGSVERLTVAVVLDSASAGSVDTTQISSMVSNAVGIDNARGDSVDVSTLAFDTSATETAQAELAEAEAEAKKAQYLDLAKKAGIGLLILAALLLLSRRGKKKKTQVDAYASDLPDDEPNLLLPGSGAQNALPTAPAAQASLPMEPDKAAIEAAEAANRDKLRSEIVQLVENQPDEVAQVIQGWLSQRQG